MLLWLSLLSLVYQNWRSWYFGVSFCSSKYPTHFFSFSVLSPTLPSWEAEPHKSTLASKKLFSLLKNSKQDSKGIAPLKKDGKLHSNTVDKANVLNQQFQSVFTPGCQLKLSQLASMAVQDLSDSGTIDPSQIPGECLSAFVANDLAKHNWSHS